MRSRLRRVIDPLLPAGRFTQFDRRVVAIIWVAGLIQGFSQSQASASLPFTRDGLGLSEGEMSLLLGLARIGAFAALPLGWMGDHRGRRRPFLLAVTLIVAGGSLAGLAVEAWQFGLMHGVLRTGTAAASGLAIVILAETVSPVVRAYSISFFGAAVSFGSGLALMVVPLGDAGGQSWRIPHLLTAVGVLALPVLIRRVPETPLYELEPQGGHWRELASGPWAPRFWRIAVINILASAYGAIGAAFATERLINDVGVSTGQAVIILLAGGTAGGIGFFIGGRLADTWGRRNTSVMALLASVAGGVALYTATTLWIVVFAALISAFGTFAFVPSGGSHRSELFPTHLRSSANTAASNAALAGSGLGLLFGTLTIDRFGLSETIYLLAIGATMAAVLTATLDETRGQDLTAVSTDLR